MFRPRRAVLLRRTLGRNAGRYRDLPRVRAMLTKQLIALSANGEARSRKASFRQMSIAIHSTDALRSPDQVPEDEVLSLVGAHSF